MHTISHLRESDSCTKQHRIAFKFSFFDSSSVELLHTLDSDSSGERHVASSSEVKKARKCKHLYPPAATETFQRPVQHQHVHYIMFLFGTQLQATHMTPSPSIVIRDLYGVTKMRTGFCTACSQHLPALSAVPFSLKASYCCCANTSKADCLPSR